MAEHRAHARPALRAEYGDADGSVEQRARRSRSSRSSARAGDELAQPAARAAEWSLRHAYDNVAPYRARCVAAGVASRRPAHARRPRALSVHDEAGSARRTIRSGCSPCRASRSSASTPRAARPASRRWSATRARDIDTWAALMARSIRAAGGRAGRHRPRRLRLRPVHRRPRRALRRRAARLHRDPDVGRADREAGAAHRRFPARHHHGHAVVHADHRSRSSRGRACDPRAMLAARSASSARSRGRKPCARDIEAARGHRRRRSLWPVGGDRSGRGQPNASRARTVR